MFLMKLIKKYFYFTALHFAVLNNNAEIVKLLLATPNIDVNIQTVFILFYILFHIQSFQ